MDAAGPPRERPTRPQRRRYGGKKKRHTLNTQVLVNVSTCMILCVATASGSMRDLTLSRQSGVLMYSEKARIGDTGPRGIRPHHIQPRRTKGQRARC